MRLAAEIGASDCELLGEGFLAQPVNAWSSGAFLVVGLAVVAITLSRGGRDRSVPLLYGAAVAFVGVGSIAFHGPQPAGSRFIHDLSIALVLAFVLLYDLRVLRGWSDGGFTAGFGVAAVALAVAIGSFPETSVSLSLAILVAASAAEIAVHRSHRREVTGHAPRVYAAIAITVAVGTLANALGRTGGPLCGPESAVQLHGLWHLLAAVALGLWAYVAFPALRTTDAAAETSSVKG